MHAHIGSQLFDLEPFRREVAQLAGLASSPAAEEGSLPHVGPRRRPRRGVHRRQRPPTIEEYVGALVEPRARWLGGYRRLLIEPGRALTANAAVTLYTVQSVKRNVSTWVAVDGGMSDNLRPMLYGAVYEAHVADRPGGEHSVRARRQALRVGRRDRARGAARRPAAGRRDRDPATGAYGYAMANNYNGVPRPPVVFCKDGDARVVVRRESYDDLSPRCHVGPPARDGPGRGRRPPSADPSASACSATAR